MCDSHLRDWGVDAWVNVGAWDINIYAKDGKLHIHAYDGFLLEWGFVKEMPCDDDDNYRLEAALDSEDDYTECQVWEVEFPRCAPCKSGFGVCCCI